MFDETLTRMDIDPSRNGPNLKICRKNPLQLLVGITFLVIFQGLSAPLAGPDSLKWDFLRKSKENYAHHLGQKMALSFLLSPLATLTKRIRMNRNQTDLTLTLLAGTAMLSGPGRR
ncbi:MAG: hypothetical protein M3Y08_09740 [Fibrobacterota bacterium]|nr:hypothetical protein [Fibrobacterota bacterium]